MQIEKHGDRPGIDQGQGSPFEYVILKGTGCQGPGKHKLGDRVTGGRE